MQYKKIKDLGKIAYKITKSGKFLISEKLLFLNSQNREALPILKELLGNKNA